ncbi:hypothetical protein, partial [Mycobacterium celatum]|uniref:hypothetical protein n=1 Tax=Mycobacterium celatum TaxID=28045 RepID=UPI001EE6C5F8
DSEKQPDKQTKNHTPTTGQSRHGKKTTTNKTTKHTIEFSNNTRIPAAAQPARGDCRELMKRTRWNILECRGIPQDAVALRTRRSATTTSYAREN